VLCANSNNKSIKHYSSTQALKYKGLPDSSTSYTITIITIATAAAATAATTTI